MRMEVSCKLVVLEKCEVALGRLSYNEVADIGDGFEWKKLNRDAEDQLQWRENLGKSVLAKGQDSGKIDGFYLIQQALCILCFHIYR